MGYILLGHVSNA